MNTSIGHHIYWANAMFSAADRSFNAEYADMLREAGYKVYLPQQATVNIPADDPSPTASNIFRIDTRAILDSQLLVACLDQETIDCGVACEIGVAFAYGLPIIGLLTDLRQYRRGAGQIYKNLYVVGAIEAVGEIVSDAESLLRAITVHLHRSGMTAPVDMSRNARLVHFSSIAPHYSDFTKRLESWYAPPWSVERSLSRWFRSILPHRVVEFGCGAGDIGAYITRQYPDVLYLGYDESPEMIRTASACHGGTKSTFTSSWTDVLAQAENEPFDLALVLFVLHDNSASEGLVNQILDCLKPGGVILIVDLSTWDLPRVTSYLRQELARPLLVPDKRIDPTKITKFAKTSKLTLLDCEIVMPLVHFPSDTDLDEYLEVFGVYQGMDLPLGLGRNHAALHRQLAKQALSLLDYPFTDQRSFIVCALKK